MENEKLVIDAVTVLANKLGTTGTHLWEVLVRQAPVSSIVSMSFYVIGIFLMIIGWKSVFKLLKMSDNPKMDSETCQSIAIFISLISFVISILLLLNIDSINIWISGLVNPEYWALQNVISTFK